MHTSTTYIVIAAFNEGPVIAGVVEGLRRAGYEKVVVVDDCSKDATSLEAEKAGALVIRHPINLGQGASLQTGITYALHCGAEYVVTFDADGQHRTEDLPRLLAPLYEKKCDAVLGSRFLDQESIALIPPARRRLLRLATLFTQYTTGLKLTDTHNGLRAFNRTAASKLNITQNRMAHAGEILTIIAEKNIKFEEVSVHISYSAYSTHKGQRASNAINILWESFFGGFAK